VTGNGQSGARFERVRGSTPGAVDARRLATRRSLGGPAAAVPSLAQRASQRHVGRHRARLAVQRQPHRSVGRFQHQLVVIDSHAQALPLPAQPEREPADTGRQSQIDPQPTSLDPKPAEASCRRRRHQHHRRHEGVGGAGLPVITDGGAPGVVQ